MSKPKQHIEPVKRADLLAILAEVSTEELTRRSLSSLSRRMEETHRAVRAYTQSKTYLKLQKANETACILYSRAKTKLVTEYRNKVRDLRNAIRLQGATPELVKAVCELITPK